MSITEVENKKLDIHAFKMKNDCKFENIEYPFSEYLSYNFFMVIVGPPQSGKSNLWLNMLTMRKKLFYKKFDKIFIISPSLKTVQRKIELKQDQIYDEYDEQTLDDILGKIRDKDLKTLIVFDDCINDFKKKDRGLFKLIMNRRHISGGVSVMIITQVFNKLDLALRKMANCLIMFKTSNRREIESVYNDFILIEKEIYEKIIKHIFQKPHRFLLYFPEHSAFFSNFNEIKIIKEL